MEVDLPADVGSVRVDEMAIVRADVACEGVVELESNS